MWLGGFWDSEGTVAIYYPKRRSGQPNRTVVASNTDPHIMDTAESAVSMLGMSYKRYIGRPERTGEVQGRAYRLRQVETIQIRRRESYEIFEAMVPLCPRKQSALEAILASYSTDTRYRERGVPVCRQGHSITEQRYTDGRPRCRLCVNEYQRKRYWAARGVDI